MRRIPQGRDVVLRWFRAQQGRTPILAVPAPAPEFKQIRVGPGGKYPIVFSDRCPDCKYRP